MNQQYSLQDFGVTRYEETLPNGLKVIFFHKPFAPISATMVMRSGSVYEPMDKLGLAHFTEHCIVAGSKTRTKEEFSNIIDSIGGYWNASTDEDTMSVECEVPDIEHLSFMKEYFAHALGEIHVTDELLKNEKAIIISEIERARAKPQYAAALYFDEVFGGGTHWGTPTLGTIESVSAFTARDIEEFFTTHCVVENMVLSVCGGCSWQEIKEAFQDISFLHGTPQTLPAAPRAVVPAIYTYEQDIGQTLIVVGFKTPQVGSRADYILGFALRYAHDGLTSRFYKKIRNERGLAYSLSYLAMTFNDISYIGTSVGVPTDRAQETINAILECYREFAQEGMTQTEIDNRIKILWYRSKRSMQRSSDWAGTDTYDELYPQFNTLTGPFPDIFNYRTTYTAAEVLQTLQTYLTLDNYYLLANGKNVGELQKP